MSSRKRKASSSSSGSSLLPDEKVAMAAAEAAAAVNTAASSVTFADVASAAIRCRTGILRTETLKSRFFSELIGGSVYMKMEIRQETGSFKERGALNCLLSLSDDEKSKGVVAASAGNHALALAYHGSRLGIKVVVVMPMVAPINKIMKCQQYGADTRTHGENIMEARDFALEIARETGARYVNGYNDPEIIAGAGTCAVELLEQVPDLDAVVVPVGGGGLVAGVALAVKTMRPNVEVIGVESPNCPSMTQALQAGKPTPTKCLPTLADGLAVPTVGGNAFALCQQLGVTVKLVSERATALAILRLVEEEKSIVEGAGAIGAGLLLEDAETRARFKGKKVAFILCGGNIDTTMLGRVLERGLGVDGRLIGVDLLVDDRPGGLAELTSMIAKFGASVKDLYHERFAVVDDLTKVNVRIIIETKGSDQAKKLVDMLKERYLVNKISKSFP